jgi:predicted nucleotidyltransferase
MKMQNSQDRDTIISRLVERLKEAYQPERIILYGSYAYGNPDEGSDIDLLIVKDTDQRPIDRRITVRRLVSDIRRKIPFSSLVVTPEEISERLEIGDDFFIEITSKGKVLYEK